jgi:hypothetical protein
MKKLLFFILITFLFSCKKKTNYEIQLTEMADSEYPDNPNLESRHSDAQQKYFDKIILNDKSKNLFDLDLIALKNDNLKISLKNLPLLEMMPTAAEFVKKDKYLTYLGVINQEWNRQQVQFKKGQFEVSGNTNLEITRVDLARNCLNAYLWEMLVYAKDSDGVDKLFWQCWFDFPHDLYQNLFEIRNNLPWDTFAAGLENWVDPDSQKINFSYLRKVVSEKVIAFEVKNNEMYPVNGERKRKRKNIIRPSNFNKIDSLLTDSTLFATFSIPGFYNTKDPRKTQLSKLGILQKVVKRNIINALGKNTFELELSFLSNSDNKTITKLVIGGIDFNEIPTLKTENVNEGFQTSMGISNHSFYETYDFMKAHPTKNNAFYTFLLDEKDNWLDSHKIGIDGPLLHFDDKDYTKLHLWILAFERHAFVGHYIINL